MHARRVAGALRNLDPAVTAARRLDAFFYQVGTIENPPYHTQPGMLEFLRKNGFPVSPYLGEPKNAEELVACIRHIEEIRNTLDFLIDGVVIKVGDFALRERMGFTEKFPRWAVAYKFEAEESVTTLRKVTWELGRTGKLTPLAHLEPVDFYGVTVRKATLNNWGDIQRKRVALGAPVWIRRSNDVIPEIMGRVGEPVPGEKPIVKPDHCPACGAPLVERGAHLFCMNRVSCRPQAVARLSHFASRNAMDIEGFSEKTAGQVYDQMNVRDPADLYTLTMEQALSLEGFKEKKAGNLAHLGKSKSTPLGCLPVRSGHPQWGRKTARDLAQAFGTLEKVEPSHGGGIDSHPGCGEIVAQSITEFFSFAENMFMIDRLLAAGVSPCRLAGPSEGPLTGMTVVVTGTLPSLSREEAEELIRQNGGKASSSVSKKTTFVLAGKCEVSKLTKAQALGIPILDEAAFRQKLQ